MDGGRRAVDQVGGYVRGTALIAACHCADGRARHVVSLGCPFAGPPCRRRPDRCVRPVHRPGPQPALIVAVTLRDPRQGARVALFALYRRRLRSRSTVRSRGRLEADVAWNCTRSSPSSDCPSASPMAGFFGLIIILPVLAFAQTAAGVIITALGREPAALPPRGQRPRLGGQRRPGVAGSPGSMELALAHRGGVVHHRHPGGAAVAWGDPASRDGCDPRGDAPPGLGRLAATRRRSHDGGSDRHGGDGRRHHRRGRRDLACPHRSDRRADVHGDRGSRSVGRSGDRRRLVRLRHQRAA